MKTTVALLSSLWLVVAITSPVAAATEVALTPTTDIQFATVKRGAALMVKQDRYLTSLSQFDCQSRLKTDGAVTASDVGKFAAQQVVAWSDEEQTSLRDVIGVVAEKMKPFSLPFPAKIILIKTTGKEEGNAAYCRGNTIILPQRMLAQRPAGLQRLLIHELFHVLSSHNLELRSQLYAIVGFQTCPPIEMPPTLRDRKLTNPDAPQLDAYINLTVEGKPLQAVPVLYASAERYDVKRGGTFFDYLTFRLMAVEPAGKGWQPVLRDGQPDLLDPAKTSSYLEQIGKNTRYIIHPDEILADNFVHMVNQTKDLASPEIVASMRKRLTR